MIGHKERRAESDKVASQYAAILRHPKLRAVVVGGDEANGPDTIAILKIVPRARVFETYGLLAYLNLDAEPSASERGIVEKHVHFRGRSAHHTLRCKSVELGGAQAGKSSPPSHIKLVESAEHVRERILYITAADILDDMLGRPHGYDLQTHPAPPDTRAYFNTEYHSDIFADPHLRTALSIIMAESIASEEIL